MTARELFNSLPNSHEEKLTAQCLENGLSVNMSGFYSKLIKDAARCNRYNSDIVYTIEEIDESLKQFRPGDEWKPIFIGFRRHGVDGTGFVMARIGTLENRYAAMYDEYFAFYAVDVEKDDCEGFYNIIICEYYT